MGVAALADDGDRRHGQGLSQVDRVSGALADHRRGHPWEDVDVFGLRHRQGDAEGLCPWVRLRRPLLQPELELASPRGIEASHRHQARVADDAGHQGLRQVDDDIDARHVHQAHYRLLGPDILEILDEDLADAGGEGGL
jgi:hypothetical protein